MRIKTTAAIIIIGFIIVILSNFIAFAANDTPHNSSNNKVIKWIEILYKL